MNIVSVVGARPQFVKLFPVSRAVRQRGHHEIVVHTGQHYDHSMSQVFYDELGLATPDHHLEVGSGSHADQTGRMMLGLEQIVRADRPDLMMVFGDTNSTIAAALVGAKAGIPIAHVESGLRSFNRAMPEEINRVVTDHLSHWLFCPSEAAVRNLAAEGITSGVVVSGDVMLDAALYFGERSNLHSAALSPLGLRTGEFILATIHRASNTASPEALQNLLDAFGALGEPIVFPIHPRTSQLVRESALVVPGNVRVIAPVGYLDMLALEKHARMVMTDSGGVQKEAYFLGTPCLTLREETEWVELVEAGWNIVAGVDRDVIIDAARHWRPSGPRPQPYGTGRAGELIAEALTASSDDPLSA